MTTAHQAEFSGGLHDGDVATLLSVRSALWRSGVSSTDKTIFLSQNEDGNHLLYVWNGEKYLWVPSLPDCR